MFGKITCCVEKKPACYKHRKNNAFTNYPLFRAQEQNWNAPGNLSDTFPVGRQHALVSVYVYLVGRRVCDHVFSEIICQNVFWNNWQKSRYNLHLDRISEWKKYRPSTIRHFLIFTHVKLCTQFKYSDFIFINNYFASHHNPLETE